MTKDYLIHIRDIKKTFMFKTLKHRREFIKEFKLKFPSAEYATAEAKK